MQSETQWVLVPREATEAMLDAFAGTPFSGLTTGKQRAEREAYAAMLSAAPSPPAGGGEQVAGARHAVADAINRARYYSPEPGLRERGVDDEDPRSQEYAYRLADAAMSAMPSSPDAAQQRIRELEEIRDAYEKWRKERGGMGMSCFVSSADQQAAFARADNALAMAVARILHQGTPAPAQPPEARHE